MINFRRNVARKLILQSLGSRSRGYRHKEAEKNKRFAIDDIELSDALQQRSASLQACIDVQFAPGTHFIHK